MNVGETINIFGLIKSIKQFHTRSGPTTVYEIADPIIGYSVSLTKFDSKLSPNAIA